MSTRKAKVDAERDRLFDGIGDGVAESPQPQVLLRAILDGATDRIVALDPAFRILACNRAYVDEFRAVYGAEARVGVSLADLLAPFPRDREAALDFFSRALRGEEVRVTAPFGDPGRARRDYELQFTPIRTADGRIVGAAHISRDVTDRVQAERALKESAEALQAIVNHIPASVVLLGSDLRLRLVNPAYQAIAPGKQMVGLTFDELWPETGQDFTAICRRVLETGEPYRREDELNLIRRRPDGPIEPAWFSWSLDRVRLPGGEWGLLNAAWETTARLRAEQQIDLSTNRAALAVDAASLGTWDWDLVTGALTWSDRCKEQFGFPPDATMTYESFFQRVHPDDRDQVRAAVDDALARMGDYHVEMRAAWPDGTQRWIEASGRVMAEEVEGRRRAGRFLGVTLDITERKRREADLARAEEALREANRDLERRVAERTAEADRLAYQLRELASELTRAEQQERQRLGKLLHDHVQQLLVAAKLQVGQLVGRQPDARLNGAARLANDLLDETLSASRSLTAELSPPVLFDGGLGPGLQWLVRSLAEKHGLIVDLSFNPLGEPIVEDVRVFLFDAVRELLFNVVKHAGVSAARVAVARGDDGRVRVTVSDGGRGFDPSLPRPQHAGGFGLFSIQQRVQHLGGRMEIDSAPGAGTRITLVAPPPRLSRPTAVGDAGRQASPRPAGQPPRPAVTPGAIRVVLVDDHPLMRQGLSGLLRAETGIEVVGEAADGEQAIALARQLRPDVVVMDISMPGMNGIDATRVIVREMPSVSVIGLSMHERGELEAEIREAGAVDYVTKGGPPETLLAAIRASAPGPA